MLATAIVAITCNGLEDVMCGLVLESLAFEVKAKILCHGSKLKPFLTLPMSRSPFSISMTNILTPLKNSKPSLSVYQRW